MVATGESSTILRGSAFGGSRAQKPKLFRGKKNNNNNNNKPKVQNGAGQTKRGSIHDDDGTSQQQPATLDENIANGTSSSSCGDASPFAQQQSSAGCQSAPGSRSGAGSRTPQRPDLDQRLGMTAAGQQQQPPVVERMSVSHRSPVAVGSPSLVGGRSGSNNSSSKSKRNDNNSTSSNNSGNKGNSTAGRSTAGGTSGSAAAAAIDKRKGSSNAPKYFEAGCYEYEVSMVVTDDREDDDENNNNNNNHEAETGKGAGQGAGENTCNSKDVNINTTSSSSSSAVAHDDSSNANASSAILSVKSHDSVCRYSRKRAKPPPPLLPPPSPTTPMPMAKSKSSNDVTAASSATITSSTTSSSSLGPATLVVTTRPVPTPPVRKTIYLIRHAESDENRRQQSLYKSIGNLRKLIMPTKEDLTASLELVDVNAQIDSDVSDVGKRQIGQVGSRLRKDEFVISSGIQLVVHSPLRRARQTSAGMLGCVAPRGEKAKVGKAVVEQQRSRSHGTGDNAGEGAGAGDNGGGDGAGAGAGGDGGFGQFLSSFSGSFDLGPSGSFEGSNKDKDRDEDNAADKTEVQTGSSSSGNNNNNNNNNNGSNNSVNLRRNTSLGAGLSSLLNPMTPDPTAAGEQAPSVSRTVELPALSERTPLEWLPINHDKFTNRIASFEKWLAEQPESVIAVVGHSHYFMCMLGLDYKFRNCDVWRVEYDASVGLWISPEEVKREVRQDYWRQKDVKRREKNERLRKEMEERKKKIQRDLEERRDRVKQDWERLLRQMKLEGYKESGDDGDVHDDQDKATTAEGNEDKMVSKHSSVDTSRVPFTLEEENLPRGWSGLIRLYTYQADQDGGSSTVSGTMGKDDNKNSGYTEK